MRYINLLTYLLTYLADSGTTKPDAAVNAHQRGNVVGDVLIVLIIAV